MSRAASRCELILEPNWLPCRSESIGATRYLKSRYIDSHRDRDWFLALATAMEVYDSLQSRALIMFYIFVRRFMPTGLHYGFDHIAGDEVMQHLLSSVEKFSAGQKTPTYTFAEQKAYDYTMLVLTSLETWMKQGKTWEDALKAAKARHGSNHENQANWRAQGLYSPAGLLAALILVPTNETSLKIIVSRLEIDWMLCPCGELNVTRGYWRGLNTQNIHTVFLPETRATVKSLFLADYTPLFHNFVECRKNIKPYLQPWAQDISLSHGPDLEDLPLPSVETSPLSEISSSQDEVDTELISTTGDDGAEGVSRGLEANMDNDQETTTQKKMSIQEPGPGVELMNAALAIEQKRILDSVGNTEINPFMGEKGASTKRRGDTSDDRATKCLKLATRADVESLPQKQMWKRPLQS
ncbi:hypothetical protein NPX13_g5248 [Xylaria arbuscula]|uniref:Uncharacterized protein n=1 Tax=Xylaria arbuscula TaxID=114810 RepID=A0A9W8NE08_9PEZI|nr:hypothetical protein NPX13_g5248 [Xylaria arbuscula]